MQDRGIAVRQDRAVGTSDALVERFTPEGFAEARAKLGPWNAMAAMDHDGVWDPRSEDDEKMIAILQACTESRQYAKGNLFLNEGINELWKLVCAASGTTAYNNANAQLGVGNGTAAAAATQTDLQGASKLFKAMEATFPTSGTNQEAVFKSVFGSGEAEFAWEEWSVRNGATADKNLNRKVQAFGTKGASSTWTLTATLSIA